MDNVKKSVLITGTTGLVGSTVFRNLQGVPGYTITGTSRNTGKYVTICADLSKLSDVQRIRESVHPDVIVHTAAISKTDYCEKNPEDCYAANVETTRLLHEIFPDALIIFFSTYAVYNTPYGNCDESCPVSPTNNYIKTKIMSEEILRSHAKCTILRPSVIFGYLDFERGSKNYFMQLLDNIHQEKTTESPVDQFFNPVHCEVIAEIVKNIIAKNATGIYNIGSNECISKYEFNRQIMSRFGFEGKYLKGVESKTLTVVRPQNGTISSQNIQNVLGYTIPSLKDMIEDLYRSTHPDNSSQTELL